MTPPDPQALFAANAALVPWVIGRYFPALRRDDREDAMQEGLLGLWKAASRYDPLGGAKFQTYAVEYIWGLISRWHWNTFHRPFPVVTVPNAETFRDNRRDPLADVDNADLIKHLFSMVPCRDGYVLKRRYLDGLVQAEVGAELGVRKMRISQIESRALARLRVLRTRGACRE